MLEAHAHMNAPKTKEMLPMFSFNFCIIYELFMPFAVCNLFVTITMGKNVNLFGALEGRMLLIGQMVLKR